MKIVRQFTAIVIREIFSGKILHFRRKWVKRKRAENLHGKNTAIRCRIISIISEIWRNCQLKILGSRLFCSNLEDVFRLKN